MKTLSRIVWSEGMHLGPQHFQAQNRYFESLVEFTSAALTYAPWGLAGIQLDADALRNGLLKLVHARGLFPDGLAFLIPESDAAPEPRAVAPLFPPMKESLDVHLAIAPFDIARANCAPDAEAGGDFRFSPQPVELADELTGKDVKTVRMARKNLRLLVGSELKDEPAIQVARIRRDVSGQFTFAQDFIPPLLRIQACEALMVLLRRLVEILDDKARTIAKPKDLSAGTAAGFSAQGISNAWFLHAVNTALTPLRHLCLSKSAHPEELYQEMVRLGGALCTFGLESHPATLPLYDHTRLAECFFALDQHIRAHLELVVPSNCVHIPLSKSANYFWDGPIDDARTFVHSRWIFAIRCSVGEADLISKTPRLVKICSKEFLPKLVSRALPGLTLTHLPVAPPAISPRVDYQYFGVDKAGPCWQHMMQTRTASVYVPGEFPNPDVDLMVVLES